jgi:hypothetical protein
VCIIARYAPPPVYIWKKNQSIKKHVPLSSHLCRLEIIKASVHEWFKWYCLLKRRWARIYLYNENAYVSNQVTLSRKFLVFVKRTPKKSSSILYFFNSWGTYNLLIIMMLNFSLTGLAFALHALHTILAMCMLHTFALVCRHLYCLHCIYSSAVILTAHSL